MRREFTCEVSINMVADVAVHSRRPGFTTPLVSNRPCIVEGHVQSMGSGEANSGRGVRWAAHACTDTLLGDGGVGKEVGQGGRGIGGQEGRVQSAWG